MSLDNERNILNSINDNSVQKQDTVLTTNKENIEINSENNQDQFQETELTTNKMIELISKMKESDKRMNTFVHLSRQRETFPDLAVYLWYSPGVITIM